MSQFKKKTAVTIEMENHLLNKVSVFPHLFTFYCLEICVWGGT